MDQGKLQERWPDTGVAWARCNARLMRQRPWSVQGRAGWADACMKGRERMQSGPFAVPITRVLIVDLQPSLVLCCMGCSADTSRGVRRLPVQPSVSWRGAGTRSCREAGGCCLGRAAGMEGRQEGAETGEGRRATDRWFPAQQACNTTASAACAAPCLCTLHRGTARTAGAHRLRAADGALQLDCCEVPPPVAAAALEGGVAVGRGGRAGVRQGGVGQRHGAAASAAKTRLAAMQLRARSADACPASPPPPSHPPASASRTCRQSRPGSARTWNSRRGSPARSARPGAWGCRTSAGQGGREGRRE